MSKVEDATRCPPDGSFPLSCARLRHTGEPGGFGRPQGQPAGDPVDQVLELKKYLAAPADQHQEGKDITAVLSGARRQLPTLSHKKRLVSGVISSGWFSRISEDSCRRAFPMSATLVSVLGIFQDRAGEKPTHS